MPITISPERPDSADARALIDELEDILSAVYAAASRHGYSVEKLIRENVAFFVIRHDGEPAGCGGIQFFGDAYGEVKRMYVRPKFRGKGLAKMLLQHLEHFARENNVRVLRLETGIHQHEAIGLYEKCGFVRIPPFGAYVKSADTSLCFEKKLP